MIVFDEDFTLLDLHEAAAELGISRSRTQNYVRAGLLAAVHHGGRWMVSQDEVERFLLEVGPAPTRSAVQLARKFRPPPRPAPEQNEG